MKTTRTLTISAVSVAAGLFAATGSASAAPTTPTRPAVDLTTAKDKCDTAIAERLTELDVLTSRVGGAKHLQPGHVTTLNGILSTAKSGLTDLKTKIDGDVDTKTLAADCESIYSGFRIFALRAPQVHLTIVADTESFAIDKMGDVGDKLAAAIAKLGDKAKDPAGAQKALDDMNGKLADATGKVEGVADSILAITPAQWNANHAILAAPSATLRTVHADVKAAAAFARTGFSDLVR